ncbi:MAG: ergothioneine biosynthesis protein EgtB [Betaproteobacteria bacterium]|nr:ergothioneine biosynthesis protein EgtB [Betaproteobacteria bacterium]
MATHASALSPEELATRLRAARHELLALAGMLPEDAWIGPCAENLNPPLWELGHIAWFQEHWCLRLKPGRDPADSPLLESLAPGRQPWADWLYNSSRIPHAARWKAPLLSRAETLAYAAGVLDAVTEKAASGSFEAAFPYYAELSLHHETMHTEAWWMMWQARGLKPPHVPRLPRFNRAGVLRIERDRVTLGSAPGEGFVFDNEKWAHPVEIASFEIDARPVTNAEFAEFVEAGAPQPVYWRRNAGAWELRRFERWVSLPADEPVIHISRNEAGAYAKWRGRSLPSAAQWVRAAREARFELGRCWEWTSDMFLPYAGFSADPYADYSVPWFGTHCELRGAGSWVTDAPLARASYRNFFLPHRRDPFAGFRTARMAESPA